MRSGAANPPITVPWLAWPEVHTYVDHAWDPENSPHHSIVGLTGAGKSYLAVNGLLRMCVNDRVLIVDTKGDDKLVSSTGRPIREIPRNTWYQLGRRPKDRDRWFRLVVSDRRAEGQSQVYKALAQVYSEGDWVIYFDELRDVTDPFRESGLGLRPVVDRIYRKGRSRHISIIAGTQSPTYVPRSFYDQASFAWIGRIRDEQRQKRLLEIGGLTKAELEIVASIQRREWLLSADNGEYFALTKVYP